MVDFFRKIEELAEKDNRYHPDAYSFTMDALNFTQSRLKKLHVSGQELLDGIREYGLQQFGLMTRTVFEHWGIRKTEDFGEIVFNMIEMGLMSKTDQDSKDDFKSRYDFQEVFDGKIG
ncbi:hypothetical protein B9J77_01370 [candidate division NPL-UPA2 bacterium Unc8]|uniref:Uncharacterized protein n=1 Tax=candidate division NPL-UPA2 bacterium Unc8 TaxID=1980939 RepID=A0A399FW91_UNCN2|nr:hypothetical protein [Bacillota bacterium]MBT9137615.1 hypothetical protein [Bacillota bacterium]MBT9147019.1 hypothetical protein [Bacillota bacterium]RII00698.1 MAG: hypothetical protein B9J77_01370 [candidate division NPL-UPA2 bacterium Unc8]